MVSANGDAARCDMRAGRIERCLAADMTVKERYALNKVAESSLYKWIARFREEDPGRFPAGRAMDWSRFLGRKISFFRQHLALGRTGRYSRSMSASSACCSRARCI